MIELLCAVARVFARTGVDRLRALFAPDISAPFQGAMDDVLGLILLFVDEDGLKASDGAQHLVCLKAESKSGSLAAVHEDGVLEHLHLFEYCILFLRETQLLDCLVVDFFMYASSVWGQPW